MDGHRSSLPSLLQSLTPLYSTFLIRLLRPEDQPLERAAAIPYQLSVERVLLPVIYMNAPALLSRIARIRPRMGSVTSVLKMSEV